MPQARTFVTTASPGGRTRVVEGSAAPEPSTLRQDRSNIYDADEKFRSAPAFSAAERDRLKRARDAALGIGPPQQPEAQRPVASVRGGRPPPAAAAQRAAPSRRAAAARGDAKGPPSPRSQKANRIAGADSAPSSPRRASKDPASPREQAAESAHPPAPQSPPSYDLAASPAGSSSGESYGEEPERRPPAFPDHPGTFSLFACAGFCVARPPPDAAAPVEEYPQYIPWGAPALWPRDEPEAAVPELRWQWQPHAEGVIDAAAAARAASAAALAGLPPPLLQHMHAPLPPAAARRPTQPAFDVEAARAAARAALAPRGGATPLPGANDGGSNRRFAAADFLPHGARSLPPAGARLAADADIDARMRGLRAA